MKKTRFLKYSAKYLVLLVNCHLFNHNFNAGGESSFCQLFSQSIAVTVDLKSQQNLEFEKSPLFGFHSGSTSFSQNYILSGKHLHGAWKLVAGSEFIVPGKMVTELGK